MPKKKVTHYGNQPVRGPKRVGVASRLKKEAEERARVTREVNKASGGQVSDAEIRRLEREWRR